MFLALALAAIQPFSGTWITDAEMARQTPRPYAVRQFQTKKLPPVNKSLQNRHILFRKAFELDGDVKSATIRITADDYYRLYVNGTFAGMGPAAGTTDCTYYNEIDVTGLLHKGRNVIAVHTYYQGLVNRVWVSGDNRHGLVLDLHADGRKVLASDTSFKTARHTGYSALGTVGYDTQFMERYDAAAPEVGFERPEFDDSGWAAATVHPLGGDYRLVPQPTPAVTVETIRPVTATRNGERLQLDFGGIYVGGISFAAKGARGGKVRMHFGQELADSGWVRHKMRCNCDYVEEFVLSGGPRDVLRQFDYKSFRYADIFLPSGAEIDLESIVLEARHLPFELKAHPNFTDERLYPIWNLCVESFRFGAQEQLMDCMDREKGYYLGDGCYTTLGWCMLTGDWSLARKFFDDFLRTKSIDRGLVTCGNCAFIQEIAEYPMMMFLFAKWYLDATGDADFIRARIPAFADVLDSYRERYAREDGLLRNLDKWCVVEWPKNYQDGYDADLRDWKVCTDLHNAINAWYIGAVICLNEMAARTGGKPYADAAPLKAAFCKVFYDSAHHLFRDREGSSHISMPANVFATFFRLAPESDAAAHHAAFLKMVRERNFSTVNMFQYFPLFVYLRTTGEKGLMHELFLSPESWRRILREGGTRSFEGWGKDAKWNTSLFHLTTAAACVFLCEEGNAIACPAP